MDKYFENHGKVLIAKRVPCFSILVSSSAATCTAAVALSQQLQLFSEPSPTLLILLLEQQEYRGWQFHERVVVILHMSVCE